MNFRRRNKGWKNEEFFTWSFSTHWISFIFSLWIIFLKHFSCFNIMSYTVTKLVSVMTSFLGLVFWLLQILVVLNYNIFKSKSSPWLDYIWCWHMRAPRERSYNIAHEHVGVLLNLTSTRLLLIVRHTKSTPSPDKN